MNETTLDTAALRALADAATPGPWATYPAHGHLGVEVVADEGMLFIETHGITYAVHDPDAAFIAAAREAVPALCDEVDRLRAQVRAAKVEALREFAAQWQEHSGGWYEVCCALTDRADEIERGA